MNRLTVLVLSLASAVALLLWVAQRELGAPALLAAAVVLWWPLRASRAGRAVRTLLLLLAILWIVHEARWIVYALLGGVLLAYILGPLVDWLERHRIRRPIAALAALLPIAIIAGVALVLLIPALIQEIQRVIQRLPEIYDLVASKVGPALARFQRGPGGPTPAPTARPLFEQLAGHAESVLRTALGSIGTVSKGLGRAAQIVLVLVLIPVTAFYMLIDWTALREGALRWMPERWHPVSVRLTGDLQTALRVYVRGQGTIALIEVVLFGIAFSIAGMDQAIAVAVLGGIFSLIPVVGFWATALLVVLTSLTGSDPWSTLLKAAIGLVVINILEGQVLTPRIQGSGLGLPPLVVLLGVLVGGTLFGFLGVILAVPVLAVIKTALPDILTAWHGSRTYLGPKERGK